MKVSFRESLEVPNDRKYDVFAFAGLKGVFMHGMMMRDAIKAIMSVCGTAWVAEMNAAYPHNETYLPRPKRARAIPENNGPKTKRRKRQPAESDAPLEPFVS